MPPSPRGDVLNYVHALAALEGSQPMRLSAAAANSGSLAGRIARLLGQSRPAPARRGSLLAAVLLVAAAYAVFAQYAPRPEFQVASIKLNTANPPINMIRPQPGGRLTAENAPLQMLIMNAYGCKPTRWRAGPAG